MATQNPFASLFAGFSPTQKQYDTPFSMKGYVDSLKKKNQSTVNGPISVPFQNTSATSPTAPPLAPTTVKPPAITSSAGQEYLKSISAAPPGNNTSMTTPSGLPITGDPAKYSGVGNSSAPASTPQTTEDPNTANYKSAFEDYIKFLKPTDEETAATKNLAALNLQAEKDQEEALNRGESLGFASGEAARVNKNNSFGIRAASDALSALTGQRTAMSDAQKARLDFTKSLLPDKAEGFTLGPDQVRYDAKGNKIAGGANASGVGGGYVEGANPTVDAYIKAVRNNTTKLENVPTQYRDLVAQGLTGTPNGGDPKAQYVKAQADEALTNIDTALGLIQNKGNLFSDNPVGRAVGGLIPGSSATNLNAALDTVKALVGFDALQKMRESSPTGGALGNITERELAFLQSVQGSLNTSQSTEQLVATINRVKQSFQTLQLINSPDGTVFELDGQKYEKRGDSMVPVGFNSVGGDTNQALNLPQRNKNPGNLKSGGLADSLAVGRDAQGHLIFPSAEVGFQALSQDLQAKISGRSTKVGPNPTIAQLGAVYAEDPKWASKVAKILGVSTSTTTASLDFDELLQAIATQEGFYA